MRLFWVALCGNSHRAKLIFLEFYPLDCLHLHLYLPCFELQQQVNYRNRSYHSFWVISKALLCRYLLCIQQHIYLDSWNIDLNPQELASSDWKHLKFTDITSALNFLLLIRLDVSLVIWKLEGSFCLFLFSFEGSRYYTHRKSFYFWPRRMHSKNFFQLSWKSRSYWIYHLSNY